jgi:ribosomal protein RSM22 (predicted rRNA methylase)
VAESGAGSLSEAVQAGLSGAGIPSLTSGVRRLMAAYRSGEVPDAPVLASPAATAAYAAYRMPATVAATAAALRQVRLALTGWAPRTLLDFGAGTGGAAWAAVDELASIGQITLLEQSAEAVRLGRAILAEADADPLRSANWRPWRLGAGDRVAAVKPAAGVADLAAGDEHATGVPTADLATACYLLGELTERQQAALVDLVMEAAPAVLLVEPGTPAGQQRILAARAKLLGRGYQVAAPCPHELGCPLAAAGDWCHFGARVQRSSMHRQVKGAELSYEDEKFSYVAAVRPGDARPDRPQARVVRRPQQRKGLVFLDLCVADGSSRRELVSKSKGETYRRARKASWGDGFEPDPRD